MMAWRSQEDMRSWCLLLMFGSSKSWGSVGLLSGPPPQRQASLREASLLMLCLQPQAWTKRRGVEALAGSHTAPPPFKNQPSATSTPAPATPLVCFSIMDTRKSTGRRHKGSSKSMSLEPLRSFHAPLLGRSRGSSLPVALATKVTWGIT